MRIVMISRVTMNPYVRLLGNALQEAEPGVACAYEDALDPHVVARWRGKADVFHIHWADGLVRSWSRLGSLRKLANLTLALLHARRAGIKIVYTAHNVQQHDSSVGLLGSLAESAVYRFAGAVHVHDDEARRQLLSYRRLRTVNVIAHGNYIGAYPDTTTRDAARLRLGLASDDIVFLALGQIRPYKGLDDLIAAFRALPSERARLVIAGHPHDPAYRAVLERLAEGDARIRLDFRFVPDDDVQYYMRAADICVLPYRSGTTSGAAILAFSFGRAVIAPDAGPFRALVTGSSGFLYAENDGLGLALAQTQQMDLERAGAAALAVARSLDWQPIARRHLDAYRRIGAASAV